MKKSNKTLRLTGVSQNETAEQIKTQARADLQVNGPNRKSFLKIFSRQISNNPVASADMIITSVAQQKDLKTATITFPTSTEKEKALAKMRKKRNGAWGGAYIDDDFRGITILHSGSSGQRVDLDICAVHGLNGHAFDTWMSRTQMWLRDHLPRHPQFRTSRIMTYGYDSQLINGKGTQSRFEDFADQLLVLLGQERNTTEERARPILFLCHSMGGLIARLAMVRYEKYRHLHPGVALGPRGLLLLSTPNAGSLVAQWSNLALELGSVLGLQSGLVKELRVLDPRYIDNVNDWATLHDQPLIRCYCESSPTALPAGAKQIVTAASAGFLEHTAMQLPDTDHHSVCKFEENISPAFNIVMGGLCDMRADLISRANQVTSITSNAKRVGRPGATAPSYPLPKPFLFNHGFRKPSRNFVKRSQILEAATREIKEPASPQHMLILIGTAGSGKTELLLDYVGQRSSESNIIILSASSHANLQTKLREYALMFGHDAIRHGATGPQSLDVWKSYTPKVQVNIFLEWASATENDCIIILDELDNVKDAADIARDLPKTARVVVSTRNPMVPKQLMQSGFQCLDLFVFDMTFEEAKELLASLLNTTTVRASSKQMEVLVEGLDRHPFAICAASSYLPDLQRIQDPSQQWRVVEILIDALDGDDYEERKYFFDFDGLWNLSISRLFRTAMAHLNKHTTDHDFDTSVRPLLQAIACLSNYETRCHFTTFFNTVQPIASQVASTEEKIDDVFVRGLRMQNSNLGKAIQSSLIIERSYDMYMPGLWRDCIMLYECNPPKDVTYWLRQILLLCYLSGRQRHGIPKLNPFVKNCMHIVKRYGIYLDKILTHPEQNEWLDDVARGSNLRGSLLR